MESPNPRYQPAAIIGVILSVVAFVGQLVSNATVNGTFSWVQLIVAVTPLVAGLLIKRDVVTRAWLYDVLVAADSMSDALHPIAEQAEVPIAKRPSGV